MLGIDANSLFARAEIDYAAGRFEEARQRLQRVEEMAPRHPAVLQLLALVEKKRGDGQASRAAFLRAVEVAPADPQIRTNFGNLLSGLGDVKGALKQYELALTAVPKFGDALYNRAVLLQQIGRTEDAVADLKQLQAARPNDAKVHSALGAALFKMERVDDAAEAFDRALTIEPQRRVALHGRARVAMERGEPHASQLYLQALQQRPGDLDLVLGLAEAMEAEGKAEGLAILKEVVQRNPDWIAGHEVLARMRAEAAEGEGFADHYQPALSKYPLNEDLHWSYWQTLARAERYTEALEAVQRAKSLIGESHELIVQEAIFTGEAGDPKAALALLDALPEQAGGTDQLFVRGRMLLKAGEPSAAARALERLVEIDRASINGWAHLDLCWRLTGDERHEWLSKQQGLSGTRQIELSDRELSALAELLRNLHRTRAHPIGQSLRGGTQTRGRLFYRQEPEIGQLRDSIMEAVRAHVRDMPPYDDRHPLLRHRNSEMAIEGSWSVRLLSQGFHVSHIHPEGILSSACYISLPDSLGADDTKAGWLEIGRPPPDIGAGLEPLAQIAPKPGGLTLFPSFMFHGTRPFGSGERLTVAFDVVAR